MNKKLLSLVLALVMVFSVFTTLFAEEETTEATETAPVTEEYIEFLKEHKIIQGDAKGDLMLDKEIDRGSFAAILVRTDDKEATAVAVKSLGSRFKDMTPAHWANGYANVASEQGWMKGNEKGEFMPSKTISYAEIATTLVRFLGTDDAGYLYPSSYIAKAFELGLFEGVREITDYAQPAIRKDIFRMIYNAISKEDFGRYTVYKMIVLENNRVAQLKANEIKAEILNVVQMPNKVSERGVGKVGEQFVFDLEGVKLDSEYMLGKVANFSVDEKGNLVKVVVDETYDYVYGGVNKYTVGEKNFRIAGRNYGVRVDERYWQNQNRDKDDRVYRTYLTEGIRASNSHYIDFYKRVQEDDLSPFVRVTAKDGMIIFVDAFAFRDVAPVKEVARDGKEVHYYNDARNGAVDVLVTDFHRIVGYNAKDGFHSIEAKDIKADDVIHWTQDNYMILVRTDARIDGKFERTFIDRDRLEWLQVDDVQYYLPVKAPIPFKAVYAYDNKSYRRLDNRGQIKDMRGGDVTILRSANGDVQLITSGREFKDNIALIDNVGHINRVSFIAPNGDKGYDIGSNLNSRYYGFGNDNNTTINVAGYFQFADLVFNTSEEDVLRNLGMILPVGRYNATTKKWEGGYLERAKAATFDKKYRDYLTVDGKRYTVDSETKVFTVDTEVDKFGRGHIYAGSDTYENIRRENQNNSELKAFVLSEKEFAQFLRAEGEWTGQPKTFANLYNRYDERENQAKVIVFVGIGTPESHLGDVEYAKVDEVSNIWNTKFDIVQPGGTTETLTFERYSGNRNLQPGQFIRFRRVKDEPTVVRVDEVLVPKCSVLKKDTALGEAITNSIIQLEDGTFEFYNGSKIYGSYHEKYRPFINYYTVEGYSRIEIMEFSDKCLAIKKAEVSAELKEEMEFFKKLVTAADLERVPADKKDKINSALDAYEKLVKKAETDGVKDEVVEALKEDKAKLDKMAEDVTPAAAYEKELAELEEKYADAEMQKVNKENYAERQSDLDRADELEARIKALDPSATITRTNINKMKTNLETYVKDRDEPIFNAERDKKHEDLAAEVKILDDKVTADPDVTAKVTTEKGAVDTALQAVKAVTFTENIAKSREALAEKVAEFNTAKDAYDKAITKAKDKANFEKARTDAHAAFKERVDAIDAKAASGSVQDNPTVKEAKGAADKALEFVKNAIDQADLDQRKAEAEAAVKDYEDKVQRALDA